jgi:RNA polymerase sigma-70 factor (sigma-E family)
MPTDVAATWVVDVSAAYAAHRTTLLRLAVLLVDDLHSAEDVVQEAFLGLQGQRGQVREEAAVFSYLRTSVVHRAHDLLRRRRTVRRNLSVVGPAHEQPADAGLLLAEEHLAVLAAVSRLPSKQREVVVLRYWSGMSEAEIASALGISRGAVKSQASRALDKLELWLGVDR